MRFTARRMASRFANSPKWQAVPRGLLALKSLKDSGSARALIRWGPEKVYGRVGDLEVKLAGTRRSLKHVVPCSMKTLSGVVNSYADSLIVRAADVVLKEQRRLVLVPRETPLHVGHCRLMHEAAKMGAVLVPPMPAFYNNPQNVDDIINHTVGRLLDLFGIDSGLVKRWQGTNRRQNDNGE